jgi:glycosyltransferase involved in cell wall biosynthesis
MEVSVVMPCLNEADTIELCVKKAWQAMRSAGIEGEVVVADNGSSDGSQRKAFEAGARVVEVAEPGYGAALMGGIASSRGRYVIMGDADDSYDFLDLARFVGPLREGVDIVQGCRLPVGGGMIERGAMPWLHRWVGNPLLSWLVRRMFGVPIHDVYCGMRGFQREFYDRLDLRCPGMEFATEMLIQAQWKRARMVEVPITLHPDGRRSHGSHLRTVRDGWRTLRLFLVYSPRWTFLYPGLGLLAVAALGYLLAWPQLRIVGVAFDVHTLLVASLIGILGWQCVLMAGLARIFAAREGLLASDEAAESISVEQGLAAAVCAVALGVGLIGWVVYRWGLSGFGELDYPVTMRWVVPGVTLVAIGVQTLMASLLAGVLRMHAGRKSR